MKTVASMKPLYVDVKIRKHGEQYELLANCDCGESHTIPIGTKDKYCSSINGLKVAPCNRILFTTLDTSDQESNRHTFEILRWQGAKWRHNVAIKAIKESPGLLESLKRLEVEYLQQNKNF